MVKILERVLLIILIIMVGFYALNLNQRKEEDRNLREVVEEVEDQSDEQEAGAETGEDNKVDHDQKYSNLFGLIEIPESRINYPVAYIPGNSSYYLNHDLSGTESISGTPFLAGECFSGCKNLIIYGHHMADGSIFTDLIRYKDYGFYLKHPKVLLKTNGYESGEYQVVGAFYSRVGDPDFDYYNYFDLRDPSRESEFIHKLNQKKLYQTDALLNAEDDFLTLSTCSYHVKDGRFVVVAKKS